MQKIQNLRKKLEKNNLSGILIFSPSNIEYFSNFKVKSSQLNEIDAFLFISLDRLILITDSRFYEAAKRSTKYFDVCVYKNLKKEIKSILNLKEKDKTGIEGAFVSCLFFEKFLKDLNFQNFVCCDEILQETRKIKTKTEINNIEKAIQVAEDSFLLIKNNFKEGVCEKEIVSFLEEKMRQQGAEQASFPTICAFGKNSSLPHHVSCETKLKKNQIVLLDWGAKKNSYCSDMTRSFFYGNATKKEKEIFKVVLEAQEIAMSHLKEGAHAKDIDQKAREHINKFFNGKFIHGLGHGVGLDVHEAPRLSPLSDDILKENMIVTIEPGIYIENFGGIRLENMFLITKDGYKLLNNMPIYENLEDY